MGQLRRRGKVWWIRYYRNGRRFEESARTAKKGEAERLLRLREGDVARGLPVSPKIGRVLFDEAAADVINDYRANGKKTLDDVQRRFEKHLLPYFGGRRLAAITTADIRSYIVQRQSETEVVRRAFDVKLKDGTTRRVAERRRAVSGVSNGEINRELTTLKRAFRLALQAGKIMVAPYVPMLKEDNVRTGFFEPEQFRTVLAHLPTHVRPAVQFAYITGWRVSEVLGLEWRRVDFAAGEVTLDPGSTKNGAGRVFPMTSELRTLLEQQRQTVAGITKSKGLIIAAVFVYPTGERIRTFRKSWESACAAAGQPGRLVHDLRRTAVRNLVRAGIPERVAMALSGHKTRSVFERYNIVSTGDIRAAATRLDAAAGL